MHPPSIRQRVSPCTLYTVSAYDNRTGYWVSVCNLPSWKREKITFWNFTSTALFNFTVILFVGEVSNGPTGSVKSNAFNIFSNYDRRSIFNMRTLRQFDILSNVLLQPTSGDLLIHKSPACLWMRRAFSKSTVALLAAMRVALSLYRASWFFFISSSSFTLSSHRASNPYGHSCIHLQYANWCKC